MISFSVRPETRQRLVHERAERQKIEFEQRTRRYRENALRYNAAGVPDSENDWLDILAERGTPFVDWPHN